MNRDIWHQLLSLESIDITKQWYKKIHGRELNTRRTKEINASMKQAREYFRNASNSDYAVRPLLTYYGVTSLSRAFLLLLKIDGGEESLSAGHGLETVKWKNILTTNTSKSLDLISSLTIQTCSGLFNDFIIGTSNRISIHVSSSSVDWRLCYGLPVVGQQFTVGNLISRLPDLYKNYSDITPDIKYSPVVNMTFTEKDGFKAKVKNSSLQNFKNNYEEMGYKIEIDEDWAKLTCDSITFEQNLPLFVHSYIQKGFGAIPDLYIAEPFHNKINFSQLSMTYMVSFILGMLVRYYPTHWISLAQGCKGDALWPTFNRAQQYVENSFPELTIEMINDILKGN